jgi:hypothetical protein
LCRKRESVEAGEKAEYGGTKAGEGLYKADELTLRNFETLSTTIQIIETIAKRRGIFKYQTTTSPNAAYARSDGCRKLDNVKAVMRNSHKPMVTRSRFRTSRANMAPDPIVIISISPACDY